jgi:hypothetical protein
VGEPEGNERVNFGALIVEPARHRHTSAYVSIRQHTSAYVNFGALIVEPARHRHTSAYVSIR